MSDPFVKHVVAPDGDVILVLKGPNAPFIFWPTTRGHRALWATQAAPITPVSPSNKRQRLSVVEAPSSKRKRATPFSRRTSRTVTESSSESDISDDSSSEYTDSEDSDVDVKEEEPRPPPPPIRFQLSSSHLIMASGYFCKMFKESWSALKRASGQLTIETSDWDEVSFLMLMNIIHGHTRSVPKQLDRDGVTKIAALVDYYQCHEVAEIYGNLWFRQNEEAFEIDTNQLTQKLAACCVFHQIPTLSKVCKAVIEKYDQPLYKYSFPIPQPLIDFINETREKMVSSCFKSIYQFYDNLASNTEPDKCVYRPCGQDGANRECGNLMLGHITKALHQKGLLSPRPDSPFVRYSWISLRQLVDSIHPSTVNGQKHSTGSRRRYGGPDRSHTCDARIFLNEELTGIHNKALCNDYDTRISELMCDVLGDGERAF